MWPFRRHRPPSEPASPTPAAADGPVHRAGPAAWRHAAPMPVVQPTLATFDSDFASQLATRADPSFLAPLGHYVLPDAPAGAVRRARPADSADVRQRPAPAGVADDVRRARRNREVSRSRPLSRRARRPPSNPCSARWRPRRRTRRARGPARHAVLRWDGAGQRTSTPHIEAPAGTARVPAPVVAPVVARAPIDADPTPAAAANEPAVPETADGARRRDDATSPRLSWRRHRSSPRARGRCPSCRTSTR